MTAKVTENKDSKGVFSPQEMGAQQMPSGAVPGLPAIVWDHRNGQYGILNQGFLAECCILAEAANVLGRVVAPLTVTIESGAVIGDVAEGEIVVPENQLWFISRLAVTCPAADADGSASFQIQVEQLPGSPWNYLPSATAAMGATTNYDCADADQLGTRLRLAAGQKLRLKLTVTVAHTADKDYTLTAYGCVSKRLVA